MSGAPVELRDVTVRLGGADIVRGVTATAREGDAIAVIGRNGAGKTTLLRAIAGLCPTRSGSVRMHGRPVAGMSAAERAARLAYVAQRPLVAAAFSVREVVSLGRFALPRDERRIDESIRLLGLEELGGRPYHELSVGQQQRVSLARALAQAAPTSLLCLDEPFASMDLGEAARSLAIVRGHAERGGVVLAVLHDVALATTLATRAWLLDDGTLAADGAAAEVLEPRTLERAFGVPFARGPEGPVPLLHSHP